MEADMKYEKPKVAHCRKSIEYNILIYMWLVESPEDFLVVIHHFVLEIHFTSIYQRAV